MFSCWMFYWLSLWIISEHSHYLNLMPAHSFYKPDLQAALLMLSLHLNFEIIRKVRHCQTPTETAACNLIFSAHCYKSFLNLGIFPVSFVLDTMQLRNKEESVATGPAPLKVFYQFHALLALLKPLRLQIFPLV